MKANNGGDMSEAKNLLKEFLGNFRVNQFQDISAITVLKIGDFTVLLDFQAATGDQLLLWRLMTKDVPRDHRVFSQ